MTTPNQQQKVPFGGDVLVDWALQASPTQIILLAGFQKVYISQYAGRTRGLTFPEDFFKGSEELPPHEFLAKSNQTSAELPAADVLQPPLDQQRAV